MARVVVSGSTDGLGLMAARLLADNGHAVSLHARNETRAADARAALPGAEAVVVGDLADIAAVRGVAEQANAVGRYGAVIHNAGVGPREPSRYRDGGRPLPRLRRQRGRPLPAHRVDDAI